MIIIRIKQDLNSYLPIPDNHSVPVLIDIRTHESRTQEKGSKESEAQDGQRRRQALQLCSCCSARKVRRGHGVPEDDSRDMGIQSLWKKGNVRE